MANLKVPQRPARLRAPPPPPVLRPASPPDSLQPPRQPENSTAITILVVVALVLAGLLAVLYAVSSCRQTNPTEPEAESSAEKNTGIAAGNSDDDSKNNSQNDHAKDAADSGATAQDTFQQPDDSRPAQSEGAQADEMSNAETETSSAHETSQQPGGAGSSSGADQSGGASGGGAESGKDDQAHGKTQTQGAADQSGDASQNHASKPPGGHSASETKQGPKQSRPPMSPSQSADALEQDIAGIYRKHDSLLRDGDVNVYSRIAANYMTMAKALYAFADHLGCPDYKTSATAEWDKVLRADGDIYSWNAICFFSSVSSSALLESLPRLAPNKINQSRIHAIRARLETPNLPNQETLLNNTHVILELLVCLAETRGAETGAVLNQAKNALTAQNQPTIRHTEQLVLTSSTLLAGMMQRAGPDVAAQARGIIEAYSAKTHAAPDSFHRLEAQSEGLMQLLRLALPNLLRRGY